jgi:phosphoglycerate dehydrogenase-like enzyme
MAEFALAAIFAHAKRFPEVWIDDSRHWGFTHLDSVSGATLGIAGFGTLGQAVARHAIAVGMKVIALRRRLTQSPVTGVELVETLEQLASRSDHLVLLMPANDATHHIAGAQLFAAAKPGLHLINLGRGTLVDQDALLWALDCGRIARATLDVTDPEPLPAGHPLYLHPRVMISPNTSVYSAATFEALVDRTIDNFARLQVETSLLGEC